MPMYDEYHMYTLDITTKYGRSTIYSDTPLDIEQIKDCHLSMIIVELCKADIVEWQQAKLASSQR